MTLKNDIEKVTKYRVNSLHTRESRLEALDAVVRLFL